MFPINAEAGPLSAAVDEDSTSSAARDGACRAVAEPTLLARQLATTREAMLRSMARDHLAWCAGLKSFHDDDLSMRRFEAFCVDTLVADANARLASPSGSPPVPDDAWGRRMLAGPMEGERFARRVASQLTEAAVCRALARQLRQPRHGVDAHGDDTLSARSLWREARAAAGASEAAVVAFPLPGLPARQLRIEGDEWVSITGPARVEASVCVGDLALIDQTGGLRFRLSEHARERVALTAIEASSPADLRAFPARWVCSADVASALLDRLDDPEMSQWMAGQPLADLPATARRIATSGVNAWRHGLVAVSVDRLGRTAVLESLNVRALGTVDDRSLTAVRRLGDAGRVHDIVSGVLAGIGKGLTADEAVSILWREEDLQREADAPRSPPAPDGERRARPSTADRRGHRYNDAFLDALAPALLDGRLSAAQATLLLDSGTPARPVATGSSTEIANWYGKILTLWRDERISAAHARSLMLGLDDRGSSAWRAALRCAVDMSDPATVLALVDAWSTAIGAGLLAPETLRQGLLSRTPGRERCELAHASAAPRNHWLSDVFRALVRQQRAGILPAADLRPILDATLDTDGLAPDPAQLIAYVAREQLATFERLMNLCLRARAIDGACAAGLLLARPDGQLSRSVRAAGIAGGDTDIHELMLDEAVRRGDLSPAQKAEALQAARGHAFAMQGREGPPPGVDGG